MSLALHASAVFGRLRESVIEELVGAVEWQHVHCGEAVFRKGEPARSTVFVISGGQRGSRRDPAGRLPVYNQVHPGESIDLVTALRGQPALAGISVGHLSEDPASGRVVIKSETLKAMDEKLLEARLETLHPVLVYEAGVGDGARARCSATPAWWPRC